METATTNYSPLDTLVRRVSSKRVNPANKLNVSTTRATQIQQAPPSPLLHSQFRSSVATDSDYGDKSYDNSRHQSWRSTATDTTAYYNGGTTPTFVVTAPPDSDSSSVYGTTHPDPNPPPNFSRPVLRSATSSTFPSSSAGSQTNFYPPTPAERTELKRAFSSRSARQEPPLQSNPQTPQEYLQLGIQHHEANRLDQSAICFEKSAKERGGCGVGMLMWGLTLRHGWGCPKNEKSGLHWLQKAAEGAVADLESGRRGDDATAIQGELVIAIYEVGQSFFQGWGVDKDKKMGVSYFQVAARLGDPDAQQSLAFCLSNGKGCKKDRKEAAKWYRAAVAQGGISDVGLAWIYKDKYQ